MYLSDAADANSHSSIATTAKAVAPATIAGLLAAIGTAGLFFIVFGPGNSIEGHGDGIVSLAAAQNAGATITPSASRPSE